MSKILSCVSLLTAFKTLDRISREQSDFVLLACDLYPLDIMFDSSSFFTGNKFDLITLCKKCIIFYINNVNMY